MIRRAPAAMFAPVITRTSTSIAARSTDERRSVRLGFAMTTPTSSSPASVGNSQRGWPPIRSGSTTWIVIATRIAAATGRRGSSSVTRRHAGMT
jgi:hypothetical protein